MAFVVKLRGLPWNSTAKDIIDFLDNIDIVNGENGIHMITLARDGRPSGEAFVECATQQDYDNAFDFNKKMMGHRYIEVFAAKEEDLEFTLRKQNIVQQEAYVKMRGLPYDCTLGDIDNFFDGLELKNGRDSIYIAMDNRSRATGEAFVEFATTQDAAKALEKNRAKIGHRYIELFRSTANEFRRMRSNEFGGSFDRNSRGGSSGGARDRSPIGGSGSWNSRGGNNFNNFNNDNDSFGNNRGNNGFGGNLGGGGLGGTSSNFGGAGNFLSGDNFRNNSLGNNNFNNGGNSFGNNRGNNAGFGGNNGGMGNGYGRNMGGGGFNNMGNNMGNMGNNSFSSNQERNNEYRVHMRGMPYDCDEKDVYDFFKPLKPVHVEIIFNRRDRPSGEADVFFESFDEAEEAMGRNKNSMGPRYIELFLKTEGGNGGGGGGFKRGGGGGGFNNR